MRSILKMPSDDMPSNVSEGATPCFEEEGNAKHSKNAFRRYALERQ